MAEYSKYNIVYRLQKWMDSVPGQTFLNYAYSWGASIVIFGTLCKLTHLPGANWWLFLGMGTEVFVFFISAFDRPFDKTAEGRDLPTHVEEDEDDTGNQVKMAAPAAAAPSYAAGVSGIAAAPYNNAATAPTDGAATVANTAATPTGNPAAMAAHPDMAQAQSDYVEELKKLVETLGKVNEQSARLATDSIEMENLNRTLTGISRVYEMQLKSASQQISTIDQINEQSRKMARQIEQLNAIYSRMIEAMTLNMQGRPTSQTSNQAE